MTEYYALHPAIFRLDGGAMFGIIPKPLWQKKIPSDELNRIELSLRVLMIKTATKIILVDTGIGDYHDEKFNERFGIVGGNDPIADLLQKQFGISTANVTDLVITHLHFDHAGGLGKKGAGSNELTFPNAKVHVHKSHYEYSLHPTARDTGSFQTEYFKPLIEELEKRKQIIWHTGASGEVLKDGDYTLNFRCSHGHTPHLLHPYDDKMIYMADLVPTLSHVPVPWVMGYDISPGVTVKEKQEFYEWIRANNLTMIFEHDMKFWGAKLDEKLMPTGVPSSAQKVEPIFFTN